MSKNKTVRNVFFAVFCFFACASLAHAESCSTAGATQNKYTAEEPCGYKTETRTCCSDKQWSDWGGKCCFLEAGEPEILEGSEYINLTDTCDNDKLTKFDSLDSMKSDSCVDIYRVTDNNSADTQISIYANPPYEYITSTTDTTPDKDLNAKYTCKKSDIGKSYMDIYGYDSVEKPYTKVAENVSATDCSEPSYPSDACCGTMWQVSRCDWYRSAGGSISHPYDASVEEYCADMKKVGKWSGSGTYSCWSMVNASPCESTMGRYILHGFRYTCKATFGTGYQIDCVAKTTYYKREVTKKCS